METFVVLARSQETGINKTFKAEGETSVQVIDALHESGYDVINIETDQEVQEDE